MIYSLICTFLVLTTFTILNCGDRIRTPKEIMAVLGLVSIIAVCFNFGKLKSSFSNKWIWFFLGWCVIDSFWLVYKHTSGHVEYSQELFIFHAMTKNLFYIALAILAIELLSRVDSLYGYRMFRTSAFQLIPNIKTLNEQVLQIVKFVALLSTIIGFYVICIQLPAIDQYLRVVGYDQIGTGTFTHRLVGTLGNPSVMSMWFAMTLPCLLYSRRYVGFGVVSVAIYLQRGATGIVAGGIAILVYLFFRNKKMFVSVVSIVIIIVSFLQFTGKVDFVKKVERYKNNTVFSDEGRLVVWKQTLKDLKEFPLTGRGLGSFEFSEAAKIVPLFKYRDVLWKHPHNEYLRILFETGVIGLFFYMMFCLSIIWKFLRSRKNDATIILASILAAFLINSITLFPMIIAPTAFLAVISCGLLINLLNIE